MNAAYRPSAELVQLLARQFDDQISPEEERRLSELLHEDRDARDYYCRLIQVHGILEWENCSQRAPSRPAAPAAARPPHSALYRGLVYLSEPLRFGFVVASVVCISLVLTFAQVPWRNEPAPSAPPRTAAVPASAPVRLVSWQGAWANAAGEEVQARLAQGEAVELTTGSAELSFSAGAKVTLLAPARIAMQTPSTVALQSGKLLAQVAPRGRGFTVVTPLAKVIDLGTEFAISVADEETFVHVQAGQVQIHSLPDARGEPISLRLAAGEARTLKNAAGQLRIAVAATPPWSAAPHKAAGEVRIALSANRADATAGRRLTLSDLDLVRVGGRLDGSDSQTRAAVFPFRLPPATAGQRVLAAKFSFTVMASNGPPIEFRADLYGLPARIAPDLKKDNAFFAGAFGSDPHATPLAASVLGPRSRPGRKTIDVPELVEYLNAQRQPDAPADQYIFLRFSPDIHVDRDSGFWIAAAEHPDPHRRPVLELVLEAVRGDSSEN